LTQGYYKVGVKLNDVSINAWFDGSFLTTKQYEDFDDFIASYVKKMELNQAYDGSTCVINYCLAIKENKDFLKLIDKFLKAKK
jgi:uncharacterized protein (DUF1015 family)